ncbi:MAG: CPBP family intramembrane glutamic endopeptidase [Planctomycetota bacterium]
MIGNQAFRLILLLYLLLAAGSLTWIHFREPDPLALLLASRCPAGVALLLGGLTGVAVVLASDFWLERFDWTDRLQRQVEEILRPMTVPRAAQLALFSGISEELLFRGALLPILGLWLSSLVFGLLHCGPRLGGWTLFAVLAGLLLGGLFLLTGGVLAPVCAHVLINGIQLVRMARQPQAQGEGEEPVN